LVCNIVLRHKIGLLDCFKTLNWFVILF